MSTVDSATSVPSEWDRLWNIVCDTPDDFSSWEQLIRVTEEQGGGLTTASSPESITRLESVYDHFLQKFPLCFGYWKKYADWQLAVHGEQGAEKVISGKLQTCKKLCAHSTAQQTFERGVVAIHNSIDLWNQYIDFKMRHSASNQEIESLLERAAACVGLDFLAHPFWDKYIDCLENRMSADPKRVLALLDRIVLIPMHQYARYYEKWRGIRNSMSPSDALDPATLEAFSKEIRQLKGDIPAAEFEALLKEKLDAQTSSVYKTTQEGTTARWVYEAEIKRSYFHVKPLDKPQLENWSKYLDFEESQNNHDRIRALYERCLVPCAQYEDLWLRYGRWLADQNQLEDARHAYERAAFTFLPANRPSAKIALALILEESGAIDQARGTFTTLLEAGKAHLR
ncbi:hypothetical protein [Parasitella parasitica]|uniref:Suppressor of forked domain-containing protein n=1 Tax=Parasitella parasitica TaxID=35722 RepID=A0A0B7N0I4_9FUNG|nr:hypothetical protein [Parasitella parasitica]